MILFADAIGTSISSIGLVLGGGGLSGFAYHTGALAVLQRLTGWDARTAEIIIGTSAGAGVGATLRGGVPVGDQLDRLLSVPTNPRSMARLRELSGRETNRAGALSRITPAAPRLVLKELLRGPFLRPARLASGLLPAGAVRTDAIGDRTAELFTDGWPTQELWLTALRLSDGELVVFGRDRTDVSVAAASEASSAIPGFFRPVIIEGERYVDGGMHSGTNADLIVGRELDLVVVVAPLSAASLGAMSQSANAPLRLFSRRQLKREVQAIRDAGTKVLVLEPGPEEIRAMGTTLMDPTRVVNTLLQTSSATLNWLAEGGHDDHLDILRAAAIANPSPPSVPLPE